MGVWQWPPRITRNSIPRIRENPRTRAPDDRAGGNRPRDQAEAIPGRRGGLGRSPSLREAPKAGRGRGPEEAAVRRQGLPGLEKELATRVRAAAARAARAPVRAPGRAVSRSGPGGLARLLPGAGMTAKATDRAPAGRPADSAENPTASLCPQGRGLTTFPAGCGKRSA